MMSLNASDLINKASTQFNQLRDKMSAKIHESPLLSEEVKNSLDKSKKNDLRELKDDDPNLILSFKCFEYPCFV